MGVLTFLTITAFVFWLIILGVKADKEIEEIYKQNEEE